MNLTPEASTQSKAAVYGEGRYVQANGTDIFYVEAGEGTPLVLLHGGLVTTNSMWAGAPVAYVDHIGRLAEHFRVIAPDTRGCGRTLNPSRGTITFSLLADDVVALSDALGLDRPAVCGFSDGGIIATVIGIRHPERVCTIVNDAGFDLFNPSSPSFPMMRQILGGSPDATEPNPDAFEAMFSSSTEMRPLFELFKADEDGAQGSGYWKTYIAAVFARTTQPIEYAVEDFARITAPTLIMAGDRDEYCSPEEGVAAYRKLLTGELAILPGVGHFITPRKIQMYIEFLERHSGV